MKPTLQTRKDGTGDCVRACVAGLLNMPVLHVPDFTEGEEAMTIHEETGYPVWYLRLQKWLAEKGYFFLEVRLSQAGWNPLPHEAYAIFIGERVSAIPNPEYNPELPCTCKDIAVGHFGGCPQSPVIEARCRHAIVGKCEGESFLPIFDPLGGNPLEAFANGHIQAVCFLVPIDPGLQLALGKAADSTIRLARQLPFSEIKDTILSVNSAALGLPEVMIPKTPDPAAEVPRIITRDEPTSSGGIIVP